MNIRRLQKLAHSVEKRFSQFQGKGWGAGTVQQEFRQARALLGARSTPFFLDIGGNKGMYAEEILRHFPNCTLVIFEPARTNQEILSSKFSSRNVVIEPRAVSDTSSSATLYSDTAGSGLASLTKRRLDHFDIDLNIAEQIETVRFDEYWRGQLDCRHIDFCKLDIEGHELDALSGFGEAINHVDLIQFEFGGCNIDTRTFFQDFWYFFNDHDFELFRITPFGSVRLDGYRESDETFRTTNYLARRKTTSTRSVHSA